MKRFLYLALVFIVLDVSLYAQGLIDSKRDYCWIMSWGAPNCQLPFGVSSLDFRTNPFIITQLPFSQNMFVTNTSISDSKGNLLCYSNGLFVSDKSHQIMPHGDTINPGELYNMFSTSGSGAYTIPGGAIMLPCPGDTSLIYLFHQKYIWDTVYSVIVPGLYYSLIDLKLNNGLGDVVTKERNIPILTDTLDISISAVRHANGRDWWILVAEFPTSVIHKFLLSPRGIEEHGSQTIGSSFLQMSFGFNIFTPDGSKFIRTGNCGGTTGGQWRIEVFDFDRCAGMLSSYNNLSFISSDTTFGIYPVVSPNSRYLYICSWMQINQYDLQSSNIPLSKQTVANFDGYIEPEYDIATVFGLPQLAPDGKIYITVDHTTRYLHTISDPDQSGILCNVSQHSVTLPTLYGMAPTYFPNFRLGRLVGSPCDTLDWTGMEDEFPSQSSRLTAYPTPATDLLTIEIERIDQSTAQTLAIFDALGRKIDEFTISPFQSIIRVDVKSYKNGLYLGCLRNNQTITGRVKFSVQR